MSYICIKQDGNKDCGVASLMTIIKHYNGNISREYLSIMTKTSKNGVNAYYLKEASKQLGFDCIGVEGDFLNLKKENLPCIAHIVVNESYKHFVVIHEINYKKEFLIIADPAIGIRTISFNEFKRITTNNYLLFELKKEIVNIKEENVIYKYIIDFIYNNKKKLVKLLLISLFLVALTSLYSAYLKIIIDYVIVLNSKYNLIIFTILFLTIYLLKTIVEYIKNILLLVLNKDLGKSLFKNIYEQILSLPYLYFKSKSTGEVTTRIMDIFKIQENIINIINIMFTDLFTIIGTFIIVIFIQKEIATILFAFIVINVLNGYILKKYINTNLDGLIEKNIILSSSLTESIQGITSIKDLNLEHIFLDKVYINYFNFLNSKTNLDKNLTLFNIMLDLITNIFKMIIIFILVNNVLINKSTIGEVIFYLTIIDYFLNSFNNLLSFVYNQEELKNIIKKVNDLYYYPKEIKRLDYKVCNLKIEGEILINKLNYFYNNKKILNNINFEIKANEKVLLYGESGSGKSTLAKLLLGFIQTERKTIYIDKKDINDYSLFDLRKRVAYISQNEFIFTKSIYENVVLDNNYDYDYFLLVAKMTKLDSLINKSSLGYNFLLEENGFNISGGERQRIILARALMNMKNIGILVIDEGFTQIDVEMEKEILINIFDYFKDKTIIVISHRLSNKKLYDKCVDFKKIGNSND